VHFTTQINLILTSYWRKMWFAQFSAEVKVTRCGLLKRFACTWPELKIACDTRERGEWLHRCSWPPLQLACAAYRLFADAFYAFPLQTVGRTSRPGYILRLLPLQMRTQKNWVHRDQIHCYNFYHPTCWQLNHAIQQNMKSLQLTRLQFITTKATELKLFPQTSIATFYCQYITQIN